MHDLLKQYFPSLFTTTLEGAGDSDRHILSLFSIALASKGKTYLELGVRDGVTTLPLLLAAQANGGKLVSVDINPTSFVCPPELAQFWTFVQSDALEFLKRWDSKQKIDFVFIDDWHTYPHVKKELAYLDPALTPSGVVLLHDLMYGGYEPKYHTNPGMWKGEWAHGGPYRAVAELNRRHWEWATLPWNSGLTLLRKKGGVFTESRMRMSGKRYIRQFFPTYYQKLRGIYLKLKSKVL